MVAEDVERDRREALVPSRDSMREDERGEEDGRDAEDMDEDVDMVRVVRRL